MLTSTHSYDGDFMSDCQELYELGKKKNSCLKSLESNHSSHSFGAKTLERREVLFDVCPSPWVGPFRGVPVWGKPNGNSGLLRQLGLKGPRC